jgi:hypothetical protein
MLLELAVLAFLKIFSNKSRIPQALSVLQNFCKVSETQ